MQKNDRTEICRIRPNFICRGRERLQNDTECQSLSKLKNDDVTCKCKGIWLRDEVMHMVEFDIMLSILQTSHIYIFNIILMSLCPHLIDLIYTFISDTHNAVLSKSHFFPTSGSTRRLHFSYVGAM